MRRILPAMLAIIGLGASLQAMAGQIPPNMIYDCQQPQLKGISKELGRRVCVQYDMIKIMDSSAPAVEAAARDAVGRATKIVAATDPGAISCRENDEAFRPPTLICAHNSDWEQHWRRIIPEGNTEPYYLANSGAIAVH